MSALVSTLTVIIPPSDINEPAIPLNTPSPIHPGLAVEKIRNIRETVSQFMTENLAAVGRLNKMKTVCDLFSYLSQNLIFMSSDHFASQYSLLNAIYNKGDEFYNTEFENLDEYETQVFQEMRRLTGIVCDFLYYNIRSVYEFAHANDNIEEEEESVEILDP